MIRVLHVVGKMHRAGQETVTMCVCRTIDRSKAQFDFLVHTREKCEYDDEIEALGGRIYHVDKVTAGPLRYLRAVQGVIRENGYSVVHLHTAHAAGFLVLLAAKRAGARVRIAHSRNTRAELPWLHYLARPLLVRYATVRLACSEQAGRWMFGKASFRVLKDAIDASAFAYDAAERARVRRELGLGDRLTVGHTGRFVAQKNHRFLAEVLRALKARKPDFRALLVGDGALLPETRALCEQYGLAENVLFLGSRGDVPSLLQAMDVFVFPSLFEGFGNSALEAQAAGLPCVVADTLPDAVMATPSITRLPLTDSPERWADEILARTGEPRRMDGVALVAQAGYDARAQAPEYLRLYEDALRPRS